MIPSFGDAQQLNYTRDLSYMTMKITRTKQSVCKQKASNKQTETP